jgi:hypothetical protein
VKLTDRTCKDEPGEPARLFALQAVAGCWLLASGRLVQVLHTRFKSKTFEFEIGEKPVGQKLAASSQQLLIPQRFHGIHLRGTGGRDGTENNADSRGH